MSERREATSDPISVITDELFHLSATSHPLRTHRRLCRAELLRAPSWDSGRRRRADLIKATLIPFFRVKKSKTAEWEQLKFLFIFEKKIKERQFAKSAEFSGCYPSAALRLLRGSFRSQCGTLAVG